MNSNKRKISIIGSTGSIGRQALEVIEKLQDKFEIIALTGGANVELLREQALKFKPKYVCVGNSKGEKLDIAGVKTLYGQEGLEEICSNKENDIALANKETLVMAGDIVMPRAKEKGVNIIPVDSEHCAIHQCIKDISQVDKLIITASGGPFLHKTIDDMKNATVAQALNHPRWSMGKKITVDSATLMNKGLEIIEAHHLFNMPYEKIDVVVHPQSIVHSAIEYVDGSVIAQLGLPSMHIPIQYAITYPERFEGIKSKSFSFADIARLDFEKPDFEKFPSVKMAYEAGKIGGSATVCMNAANEEAVFAFLEDKIKLYEIYQITSKMMEQHHLVQKPSIDEIFEIDKEVRVKRRNIFSVFYSVESYLFQILVQIFFSS